MDINTIFLYFVIYSFIGWILETIYCSTLQGKFVYRGFLNGPICPIYGFGALLVLDILEKVFDFPILVFILGVLVTSTLEYITSYLLELFFNMKWWDYSKKKFNINGRVCLLNSTLFGILCLVLVYAVHPKVKDLVKDIPSNILQPISFLLFATLAVDFVITVAELLKLKSKLTLLESKLQNLESKVNTKLEERQLAKESEKLYIKNYISDKVDSKKISTEDLLGFKLGLPLRRIFKSYPSMQSIKNPKSIKKIRDYMDSRRN